MILPLLMLATFAGPTDAGEVPALVFAFTGCPDDEAREIEELVRADVSWAPGDPAMVLALRCDATGILMTLKADDSPAGERLVNLTTTPAEARARTAALIATELILVGRRAAPPVALPRSRAAASAPPEPDQPPPSPPERNVASRPRADTPPFTLLVVAGASSQQVSTGAPLFEGGARLRWSGGDVLAIAIDGGALFQRRAEPLGTLVGLGGNLSAVVEARASFAGGSVHGGLGARAMALRLSGSAGAGGSVTSSAWGSTVGPLLRVAVSRDWPRMVAELALAGGWCGPDVVGTVAGTSPIGAGGWWGGVSLAAGWVLGLN